MPPKGKRKAKKKTRTRKKASVKNEPASDQDSGYDSDFSAGTLYASDAEEGLGSWTPHDQKWAFADTSHLVEETAAYDERGEPIFDVEAILRWRRHPRRGFHQYRTAWAGYPIWSSTWEPVQNFDPEDNTIEDFWSRQGGRPDDVPAADEVYSDEAPSNHDSDTDRAKFLPGPIGREARKKLRREYRRDKIQLKAFHRWAADKEREEEERRKALREAGRVRAEKEDPASTSAIANGKSNGSHGATSDITNSQNRPQSKFSDLKEAWSISTSKEDDAAGSESDVSDILSPDKRLQPPDDDVDLSIAASNQAELVNEQVPSSLAVAADKRDSQSPIPMAIDPVPDPLKDAQTSSRKRRASRSLSPRDGPIPVAGEQAISPAAKAARLPSLPTAVAGGAASGTSKTTQPQISGHKRPKSNAGKQGPLSQASLRSIIGASEPKRVADSKSLSGSHASPAQGSDSRPPTSNTIGNCHPSAVPMTVRPPATNPPTASMFRLPSKPTQSSTTSPAPPAASFRGAHKNRSRVQILPGSEPPLSLRSAVSRVPQRPPRALAGVTQCQKDVQSSGVAKSLGHPPRERPPWERKAPWAHQVVPRWVSDLKRGKIDK